MKGVRYSTVPYHTGTVPGIPFREVINTNSYDLLITYEFVCGNSYVSIHSINDGALFGSRCEETREDAIFFMCEGPIRVEQILEGRNCRS
jgi:hypothetical protein